MYYYDKKINYFYILLRIVVICKSFDGHMTNSKEKKNPKEVTREKENRKKEKKCKIRQSQLLACIASHHRCRNKQCSSNPSFRLLSLSLSLLAD